MCEGGRDIVMENGAVTRRASEGKNKNDKKRNLAGGSLSGGKE